jgi:hypothetical protein
VKLMQNSPSRSGAVNGLKVRGMDSGSVVDYENAFFWFSQPARINKLLAHHDLYKSILNLPGDVFELGVYKGTSLIRWATFRNLLENDFSRRIVGFDAYGAFPREQVLQPEDHAFIERFEGAGGEGLSEIELEQIFTRKGIRNVHLVKGNVFSTLDEYLGAQPQTRIVLLHLDMDVREPTAYALEHLYDRIVPGGLIVIDDYNAVAGATDAVDEFVARRKLSLQKLSHYFVPAYIRKP